MNFKKKWLLSVCAVALCIYASAQEKYSKVRVATPTQSARSLTINSLELDHYKNDGTSITAVINSSELETLKHSGLSFEILEDDAVKATIDRNKNSVPGQENDLVPIQGSGCQKVDVIIKTPVKFGLGGTLRLGAGAGNPGYFTYAQMITAMQDLATSYPNLVKIYTIGNSGLGTAIYGVKISDNVATDEDEPEVLFTGLQHAREAIGGTSLIFYMQYLIENYSTGDGRIKELVDNREIFIIPCLNPDGYAFNYGGSTGSYPVTGGGLWRKSRRNTGGGSSNIGVDLNRNYGVDWGNCAGASSSCGSSSKTQETYFGTSAFSEPETQALRDFVYQHHFINAIDQHCFGPYYSLPYGRPSLHAKLNHVDSAYYTYIPALMGTYNGHRAGNSPETVNYEVAGGIKDWLLMGDIGAGTVPKTRIYGMTGEAGGDEFWAPVDKLMQLCKENCFQNIQIAYAAGSYFDLQDMNDIAVTTRTGNFSFIAKRVGLGNKPFTVSIIPLENIQSVGSSVTSSIPNYYDTYSGNISYSLSSNYVSGQRLRFVWKLETDGITILDTVTKFYNPLSLLTDDMEGSFATNWTGTISPVVSPASGWAFTTLSPFQGTHSMTESPGGNYTANSTRTVTCKSTFNLADASAAYLSFWTRFRAENFRDKLQVQVSIDGAGWYPVCGSNMVSEENLTNGGSLGGKPALTGIRDTWTRELIDLTRYKDSGTTIKFRFQFTSDNDASAFAFEKDDGFYIDNVRLVKTANISTLGVKFVNFYAKLLANNTVQLDWEAYTDQNHAYFDVEKATAANGTYTSIAKVPGLPPYKSYDLTPNEGNNFYRIKQVDKDGTVTYSKVVVVYYSKGKTSTIIYPNPVKDILSVKIANSVKRDNVTLTLTNTAGQLITQQPATLKVGETEIKMDLSSYPPQVYFLKITNSGGETISIEKIIKQ